MQYRFFSLLIFTITISFSCIVQGSEVVRNFSGSGNSETAEFEVEAPWLIDWVVNGDYPQMLGIEVSLIEAKTGTHAGYVLKTKYKGNGVRLFNEGGRFRLRIDASMARWNFKIEQLSRQEAEQYTPVEKNNL
jgi:hypothetical protein